MEQWKTRARCPSASSSLALRHVESLTAERLRAERLCTILKRSITVNV
ncbi:MAG: hypothetical protein JRI30_08920 [Deltaproteobacteria bacterium]|nr:hypothetical protein [Deltaproteobacteria bacterium]